MNMIDAHIHLDRYQDEEIKRIVLDSAHIEALISVSFHLDSSKRNLLLSQKYPMVKPAFGYHPEQALPSEDELNVLLNWMDEHRDEMIAVGEVGLPYYLRQEQGISIAPYLEVLEVFISNAKIWDKPIVLHAVYDDAPLVCDLLEKYSVSKAHFHWFKGDQKTIDRMIRNGYHISITPDVVYEQEIQQLVSVYPLEHMMVETDGPWPFEGPFAGKVTHPNMIEESIRKIALLKKLSAEEVSDVLHQNTKGFYHITT
ncbi:TatD family hydrolase [Neobacillus sp. MER 74]|uniref:TatD family hydrolase n=1 Tax=Neobacillus sp. MER 74 TaxID=2939566 RepID=UPI0020405492|nr:TatD family hydrolase [Neobacillus sp. MER 74]MCM3118108.1 TatD family hydrolase [Neobacillus sp. MER 74]